MEELSGQIERITFTSEDTGFTVARVKVHGMHELVTVVGHIMAPAPGEILTMQGEWSGHAKFGQQFKVSSYQTKVPATVFGIQKYLGSGLIKGIGPKMAARIVTLFGEKTLDVIETDIEKLTEVEGIGHKRIQMIAAAWASQREIRTVMLFLQSHGVSPAYATKIYKHYGDQSIGVVKTNPYRLATDVAGIGFITADRIAEQLGICRESPQRAGAGLIYVLQQMTTEGHVFYPRSLLLTKAEELLQIDPLIIEQALAHWASEKKVVIEQIENEQGLVALPRMDEHAGQMPEGPAVYLAGYHRAETQLARRMLNLMECPRSSRVADFPAALEWVQQQLRITLAARQIEAVQAALENKMLIITGGPGTGKTTIISAILKIFQRLQVRVLLAAPTGRAAKRMQEATGLAALTIHRLLEYSFKKGGFQKNEDNPLACDLLIVDEVSMIDILLMYRLMRATPPAAVVILVGDVHQLPSVGAGNVLNALIDSRVLPVVLLQDIFRQAEKSDIIVNAHRINSGQLPRLKPGNRDTDFYFIHQDEPERIQDTIIKLVSERIPKRFGLDAFEDIQVLVPMHRGVVGAANLNRKLQEVLNPDGQELVRGARTYRVNDKVMQIRNNYDKDVYNGDMGRIQRISIENQEMLIGFEGRLIPYDFSELDEIDAAYAISIHKSQGSEYPAVVIPIATQHYILLQRKLIYTAVTRGKKLVVIVGSPKAMAIAVNNNASQARFSRLGWRLQVQAA